MDSCHYWEKSNYCTADEVEVRRDNELGSAAGGARMEIGTMAGNAETSASTACKTFKPKAGKS